MTGMPTVLDRFSLDGKVAVVTGASSGLGAAFSLGLGQAGADVVLGARRAGKLATTGTGARLSWPCVRYARLRRTLSHCPGRRRAREAIRQPLG
jgi:NAD(P)-dependent dehydrogenase (short-subunit alcohol dehydrogenase family)